MTVVEELRAGQPGEAFESLLRRTVLAVAVARGFPPPGGGTWTQDEVGTVAAEFLADGQTPRRLADLALHCLDDTAVARRLQGAVRNFLRDRGRATEVGRLIVRVRRALRENPEFVHVGSDRWALAISGDVEPSTATPDKLVAATADVEVVYAKWSSTSRRRPPFAERSSIDALVRVVLAAADGSVTPADIAAAVAPRLAVVARPVVFEVDDGDYPDDVAGVGDTTGDEVVNRLRAEEVLSLLSDRERIALAYIELPVRDLGPLMGVGSSQAHVIRQRAVALLREELSDEDGGEEVAETVLGMARMFVAAPDTDFRSDVHRA
ncbi:MAG: hypothetical protein M3P97_00695 [Actinomycetota bacterium]|nr:hypothetical protein [Actinomycetota bacterium]